MTAKDTATWSKVVNQEEALLNLTDKCLKITYGEEEDQGYSQVLGSISEKRKRGFDQDVAEDKLYACQNAQCPQSEISLGFADKNSRMNHESLCAYRMEHGHVPFHEYMPNKDEKMTSEDDWMNMELARANLHDAGNLSQAVDIPSRAVGDYSAGYWLNGIDDLDNLHDALEIERDSNMDLNQNPDQQKSPHVQEATSI